MVEAYEKYNIEVVSDFKVAISTFKIDAFIISLPPDVHHIYMKKALELSIPSFIEASVLDTGFEEMLTKSIDNKVLLAPSCTLFFHPAIKKIAAIIKKAILTSKLLKYILFKIGYTKPILINERRFGIKIKYLLI